MHTKCFKFKHSTLQHQLREISLMKDDLLNCCCIIIIIIVEVPPLYLPFSYTSKVSSTAYRW